MLCILIKLHRSGCSVSMIDFMPLTEHTSLLLINPGLEKIFLPDHLKKICAFALSDHCQQFLVKNFKPEVANIVSPI